jgi:CHASE2 domain-containing sensor protein/two-component sensor histidine kinase
MNIERFKLQIKQILGKELRIWRMSALPGLVVIAIILIARLTGSLQTLEWALLDYLMRLRPPEPLDEQILIVGINEEDIRQIGQYPIPDAELNNLIQALQRYQPAVIGLDIFRDLPQEPGHADLVTTFQTTPNLIGIEKILPDTQGQTINPPPALPPEQVGFADAILDTDGFIRRSLLDAVDAQGNSYFSLTFRLAERYLQNYGYTVDNGLRNPAAMRFGETELPPVQPNTGGYVNTDAGGNQILINFRSGESPFRIVSMQEILNESVNQTWIRNRIILIGITSLSAKDVVNVGAVSGNTPGLVYGVEVQAHAISQIVQAVLAGRPLLTSWWEGWDYLWIITWGLLGVGLGRLFRSPLKVLLGLGVSCLGLFGLCFGLLLWGWWVPFAPALLGLVFNGAGLAAAAFYRHEQDLRMRLRDRQLIIDQTFDTIHNGPLQTLAQAMRTMQERQMATDPLYANLEQLNHELRAVYESMRRAAVIQSNQFFLSSTLELNLDDPIHEVLYEVYDATLERDFPYFKTLKLTMPSFEPIQQELTLVQKQGLCRFLEEALCNVGKHAVGVTQLEVILKQESEYNILRITDNGSVDIKLDNVNRLVNGRGTRQARTIAKQLGGQFRRFANHPQGTVCELIWAKKK